MTKEPKEHLISTLSINLLHENPPNSMDSHFADEKLKELHVEEVIANANDRSVEQYAIDPVAEKALLRKLDVRVVPMLWFLFMLAFLDVSISYYLFI